jgi:hypothetical protein
MTARRTLRQMLPRLIIVASLIIIVAGDLGYISSLRPIAGFGMLFGIGLEFVLYYVKVKRGRGK